MEWSPKNTCLAWVVFMLLGSACGGSGGGRRGGATDKDLGTVETPKFAQSFLGHEVCAARTLRATSAFGAALDEGTLLYGLCRKDRSAWLPIRYRSVGSAAYGKTKHVSGLIKATRVDGGFDLIQTQKGRPHVLGPLADVVQPPFDNTATVYALGKRPPSLTVFQRSEKTAFVPGVVGVRMTGQAVVAETERDGQAGALILSRTGDVLSPVLPREAIVWLDEKLAAVRGPGDEVWPLREDGIMQPPRFQGVGYRPLVSAKPWGVRGYAVRYPGQQDAFLIVGRDFKDQVVRLSRPETALAPIANKKTLPVIVGRRENAWVVYESPHKTDALLEPLAVGKDRSSVVRSAGSVLQARMDKRNAAIIASLQENSAQLRRAMAKIQEQERAEYQRKQRAYKRNMDSWCRGSIGAGTVARLDMAVARCDDFLSKESIDSIRERAKQMREQKQWSPSSGNPTADTTQWRGTGSTYYFAYRDWVHGWSNVRPE